MASRVNEAEVEITAMRAHGPGDQNLNKVSTAVRLRFDIRASSLPVAVNKRLPALPGRLALPHQRFLTIRAVNPGSRPHLQHSFRLRAGSCVASTG
ncbi:hypothetical protein DW355_09000 [Hylemonella gracilis]|uniref:Uncharacterized protein n=1 Tax=Hylemonella gracilis TaxID=80880 RepID=A0A4P6UIH0_9BURK|nr:hypothetical protein DW355_09000 [Hylemonella gracilis]